MCFSIPTFGVVTSPDAQFLYDAYCECHPSPPLPTTSITRNASESFDRPVIPRLTVIVDYTAPAIWKFTLLWTLLLYGIVFLVAGLACLPFARRHLRLALIAPLISVAYGLALATFSATIVGFAIAAIYSATGLGMSTFVPALYSAASVLSVILSSYSTVGMM